MRINACDFNLSSTLECGQVFRWDKTGNNEYAAVLGRSILKVKQEKNNLLVKASSPDVTPSVIKAYFDLTLDLPYIYNKIGRDNHIKATIRRYRGLRIIKQPLWECLASFIISAYNNIPRIKGIIYNISRCLGEKRLIFDGITGYSFPEPLAFADSSLGRIRCCGTGFRAGYLKKTAWAFLDGRISCARLKSQPYPEAKKALMSLDGVGPKVADCVLLYAVGRFEAFPVDVWIKRIMEKLYFNNRRVSEARIREFAAGYFGEYAGYAQQYLYHWGRSG